MHTKTEIYWKRDGEIWQLQHNHEVIISLGPLQGTKREFAMGTKKYKVGQYGFWGNWMMYDRSQNEVLKLSYKWWSSVGVVRYRGKDLCECCYSNSPQLNIAFKDRYSGRDLFTYQVDIDEKGKHLLALKVHLREVPTNEFLFLLALGMAMTLQQCENEIDSATLLLLTS